MNHALALRLDEVLHAATGSLDPRIEGVVRRPGSVGPATARGPPR